MTPLDLESLRQKSRLAVRLSLYLYSALVPLSIAGANISWGLLLASLVVFWTAGGRLDFSAARGPLWAPLWLFFGAAVLSSALGVDPLNSLGHLNKDFHKVWLCALFSIALALEPAPACWFWLAAGFVVADVVGISRMRPPSDLSKPWEWVRAHAFVHPVTYGEQLAVALLGGTCLLLRPTGLLAAPRARKLIWAFVALTAAALLLSQTRAAMLALIAGLISIGGFIPKMRRVLLAAIFCTLSALILTEVLRYEKPTWTRLSEPLPPAGSHITGPMMRLTLWRVAWAMGEDHPWTGVGPRNYRLTLPTYIDATFDDGNRTWGSADNLFLNDFAERGSLGLIATLLLIAVLIGRAFQRARESPDFPNLWSFSAAVAFVVMNLTEVALQTEIVWMLVFFIWLWAERHHRGNDHTTPSAE